MRILWIHQFYATPNGWGAVRTYEFARRFCTAGHAVDVVCCLGYDESLTAGGTAGPTLTDGMRVYVSRAGYKPHMGFARRIVSFLLFMGHALAHVLLKGHTYDLAVASSGPLTVAIPALIGLWAKRLPFVFEVIDVWPDSAIAAGVLRSPTLKWLSFRLEALAYKYAAAIVTCSTGMTDRVSKKLGAISEDSEGGEKAAGRPESAAGDSARALLNPCPHEGPKVVTVSNCCDLAQFVPDANRRRATRSRLGVGEDQMVVLYTGAMGVSNAIPDIVEALQATRSDSRIVWFFAGGGPAEELLRAKAQDEAARPDAIRWFGTLTKKEVVELYMAADVNLVTFMHEPLFDENSPNKFFDGIAAGLPTVFNRSTWLEPWLTQYGCGIVCKGVRPGQELAEAILDLARDPARRQRMGLGARRLAEEVFSRDRLAEKYLSVLVEAVRGREQK